MTGTHRDWWRDTVVYQIYPRSFADADSDGVGVGDIPGMIERLDYLAALGVSAVWVSPWYPSPMADGGYDVSDYCDIDPSFGTLADADAFIAGAHARDPEFFSPLPTDNDLGRRRARAQPVEGSHPGVQGSRQPSTVRGKALPPPSAPAAPMIREWRPIRVLPECTDFSRSTCLSTGYRSSSI